MNGSGSVSFSDVLAIINSISVVGNGKYICGVPREGHAKERYNLDVDGNCFLTYSDVMQVYNYLRNR
ncbi:MAG: hypothetical protein KDD62_06190 [Bdellovibrionales bacterium]|nr:hypothetical protein [Bdellovibrionales bacterium]